MYLFHDITDQVTEQQLIIHVTISMLSVYRKDCMCYKGYGIAICKAKPDKSDKPPAIINVYTKSKNFSNQTRSA